jgi:hypothetical protein
MLQYTCLAYLKHYLRESQSPGQIIICLQSNIEQTYIHEKVGRIVSTVTTRLDQLDIRRIRSPAKSCTYHTQLCDAEENAVSRGEQGQQHAATGGHQRGCVKGEGVLCFKKTPD